MASSLLAIVRVELTQRNYDIFGTRRSVPVHAVRTSQLPVPLGESPVYVVGARGLKATVRPDPGYGLAQTERHFGLGDREEVDVSVEFYPSGQKVWRRAVRANDVVVVREE